MWQVNWLSRKNLTDKKITQHQEKFMAYKELVNAGLILDNGIWVSDEWYARIKEV